MARTRQPDRGAVPRAWRAPAAILLVVALSAACSSPAGERSGTSAEGEGPGGTTAEAPVASTGATSPTPPPAPTPSPAPEPPDAARSRFAGRISTIPAGLSAALRESTWHPGCPVPLEDLRLLRFNSVGFDGEIKRGPMIVNASVAEDVLWVFEQLFDAGFQLKRVGLAREFHERRWEEQPNSRRSVTASFNCRVVITPAGPGTEFSQHSYGLAVDVNPLQNPFVRADGWVRNRFARAYVDRAGDAAGMIHDGDVVVSSFAAIGWAWGGRWSGGKDYMHFSLLG